jgi:hypothetical protein
VEAYFGNVSITVPNVNNRKFRCVLSSLKKTGRSKLSKLISFRAVFGFITPAQLKTKASLPLIFRFLKKFCNPVGFISHDKYCSLPTLIALGN